MNGVHRTEPKTVIQPSNGRVLACDVDGTLITHGRVHTSTVEALKRWHAEGKEIILWSARGTEYTKQAAEKAGITHLCTAIIGKPSHIIDDQGAQWIRFCRRIIPANEDKIKNQPAKTSTGKICPSQI